MPRLLMALFALMVCLGVVNAAPASDYRLFQEQFEPSGTDQQRMYFDIRSFSGNVPPKLDTADLIVRENGDEVPVYLDRSAPNEAIALVLAIDDSGSMKPYLDKLRGALSQVLNSLPSSAELALVSFDDVVDVVSGFGSNTAQMESALAGLLADGPRTELFFGVNEALGLFQQDGLPTRRYLIVASDGMDEGGAYDLHSNLDRARALGVGIISLGVQGENSTDWRNLQRLATETGGVYLPWSQTATGPEIADEIGNFLDSRWSVTWTSKLPHDGATYPIDLKIHLDNSTLSASFEYTTTWEEKTGWNIRPWWHWAILGGALLLMVLIIIALARAIRGGRHEDEVTMPPIGGDEFPTEPFTAGYEPKVPPTVIAQDAEPAGRAYLDIIEGNQAGLRIDLNQQRVRIGRDPSSDAVIDDQLVSRSHCQIFDDAGVFFLESRGTDNGTTVGEELVLGSVALGDGDRVKIGDTILMFHHNKR